MKKAVIIVRDWNGKPEILQGYHAMGRIDRVRTFLEDVRADEELVAQGGGYPGAQIVRLPRRFAYCVGRNRIVRKEAAISYREPWSAEGHGSW